LVPSSGAAAPRLPQPTEFVTAERIEHVLTSVEGWKRPGNEDMRRILACCPVSGEKFLAALQKTKAEATTPNFRYFAGCLETECKPKARAGPKRVVMSKQDESFRAALEATYGPEFAEAR
jgi:hypothetical protein